MEYVIVSDLVGTPGEPFVPTEGINVEALVDGGFIAPKTKPKKSQSED